MGSTSFKKYMKKNPQLKSWMKTNDEWFRNNPQAIRSMIDNPEILASFNHSLIRKSGKLSKRIRKYEQLQAMTSPTTKRKRKFRLRRPQIPSLSVMNERISNASEMLEGIQSFMQNIK
jgi:hypothetical protein